MTLKFYHALFFLFVIVALTACGYAVRPDLRRETAKRLAHPSFMHERHIQAEPFVLTAWERVREPGGTATVYIEGDGLAWLGRHRPSLDPTPLKPVGLHLAAYDKAPNVVALARPCQYTKMTAPGPCDMAYWTGKRFAPEAVDSMNAALDDIRRRYQIKGFHLVGYSGGGGMAALLTAKRYDVLSLRTVAGNLDHVALNTFHNVSPMPESLNPVSVAAQISHIPQHHFIGEFDETVPALVYDSFRRSAGQTTCMRSSIVGDTGHEKGWVNRWPVLLDKPVDCLVGRY